MGILTLLNEETFKGSDMYTILNNICLSWFVVSRTFKSMGYLYKKDVIRLSTKLVNSIPYFREWNFQAKDRKGTGRFGDVCYIHAASNIDPEITVIVSYALFSPI